MQRLRFLRLHGFAGRFPDLGFHAAAANGAYDGSVVTHQHLGRLKRGYRSAHVDDGCQGAAAAFSAEAGYLFVDIHAPILADSAKSIWNTRRDVWSQRLSIHKKTTKK